MELKDLLEKGFIIVLDPSKDSNAPENSATSILTNVNSFLAEFGGMAEEVALVAKKESGHATYRSFASPKDPDFPIFFKDFTELVSNLGIASHAIVSSFGDAYMARDSQYTLQKSGGLEIRQFVCPSNATYWRYLASVVKEVCKHPIQSILLTEHLYPRSEYCFCRRCRASFAEMTGLPLDTYFTDISKDEDLLAQFIDWRTELIASSLAEIVDAAKQVKPDIDFSMVVPIDPETGWFDNLDLQFGIRFDLLTEIIKNFTFHIMPFSPIYPRSESDETYKTLVEGLNRLRSRHNITMDLFIWSVQDEESLDWLLKMKQTLKAKRVFVRLDTPPLYTVKREIHRGLT